VADADPLAWRCFKIYTSQGAGAWRALKSGEVVDKSFSWKTDPKQAWKNLLAYLKKNAE